MALNNDFWQYASATYALPKAADNLLFLQDNYQLDVIALLFLGWIAKQQKNVATGDIDACLQQCKHWQSHIIGPLRKARRAIKRQDADLYQQAKTVELNAERVLITQLQQHIEQAAIKADAPAQSIDALLHDYLQRQQRPVDLATVQAYLHCLK